MKVEKPKKAFSKRDVETLWSKAVKDRDGWTCQICKRDLEKIGSHAHAHHIMRKQSTFMRFNLDNGVCLCAGCHKFGVHNPDGDISRDFVNRLEAAIGKDRWNRLKEQRAHPPKMKYHEAFAILQAGKE